MRASKRRGIVVLVMMFGALALSAQTPPLNPTVTVLIEPAGPVPPGCVDGEVPRVAQQPPAPVPPRPQPAPPRSEPAAPQRVATTGDVRSNLRDAHAAATGRDRAAFDASVAAAKAMSPGASAADRPMAAGVLDVYEDMARLWDYQFNTPTGSFFDESVQGGSLLGSLKGYPGYEAFIEPNTIRDANGARYYPTRESMDFLIRVAGERLTRGGAAPTRVAETTRVEAPKPAKVPVRTSAPAPSPAPMPVPTPVVADRKPPTTSTPEVAKPATKRSTTPRSTTPARRRARSTTPAVVEKSEPSVARPSRSSSPSATTPSKRAAASPASPAPASSGPVTTAPPIEDPLFPQGVVSEPSPTDTMTTTMEPAPMATDTMATDTMATDTMATEPAADTVAPQE
ncbi:MAG: hypothetical protein ACXW2P_06750, partial [Thermoanaerobaculia bacterium]